MYPYLKKDTFFIKLDNGGIFFRNNYGNIKINNSSAYELFISIYPYMDGKYSISYIFENIPNGKLKKFLEELISLLVKKQFLFMKSKPYEEESELAQILSYYGIFEHAKIIENLENYEINIVSDDNYSGRIFESIFSSYFSKIHINSYNHFDLSKYSDKSINILISPPTSIIDNVANQQQISKGYIVTSHTKDIHVIDLINISSFTDFPVSEVKKAPYHAYNLVAGILSMELFLSVSDVRKSNFVDKEYVYSLQKLKGIFKEI